MSSSVSLYLVSGFLGSGKTTFLRNILSQVSEKKVGLIVNEFGNIGIDGKVLKSGDVKLVEINNGSIFCSCLKSGFVKTLVAFLGQPVDTIFIEASGMADPTSIQSLLEQVMPLAHKKMKIEKTYNYKGSICIVDCKTFIKFVDLFAPTRNQIIKSNLIIANKTDLVEKETLEKVHGIILALNPTAFIIDSTYASISLKTLDEHISIGKESDISSNIPLNRPESCILEMGGTYSRDNLVSFCKELSGISLRIKGIVKTYEGYVHLDSTGDYISLEPMKSDEKMDSICLKLVIIGPSNEGFQELIRVAWSKSFETEICFYEE